MTAVRANFKYIESPDPTRVGLLIFSGLAILLLGGLNLFYGIAVLAGSDIFITEAAWLVGNVEPWGWLMVIIGLIQIPAGIAIMRGSDWARWVGIASACLNIVSQAMFMSDLPGVAIVLIGVDLTVIYGLLVYGGGVSGRLRY